MPAFNFTKKQTRSMVVASSKSIDGDCVPTYVRCDFEATVNPAGLSLSLAGWRRTFHEGPNAHTGYCSRCSHIPWHISCTGISSTCSGLFAATRKRANQSYPKHILEYLYLGRMVCPLGP